MWWSGSRPTTTSAGTSSLPSTPITTATTTAWSASSADSAAWTSGIPERFATLTSSPGMPPPANIDAASAVPPVLTKTWYHTGAYFGEAAISAYLQGEYARAIHSAGLTSDLGMLLDDTVLPGDILLPDGTRVAYALSPEEFREACRALRGIAAAPGGLRARRHRRGGPPVQRVGEQLHDRSAAATGTRTSTACSSPTRARRSTSTTSASSVTAIRAGGRPGRRPEGKPHAHAVRRPLRERAGKRQRELRAPVPRPGADARRPGGRRRPC